MELTLSQIGNSQGVRIPHTLIKQMGFKDTINVTVKNRSLVLTASSPRAAWVKSFAQTSKSTKSTPFEALTNQFDETDWQW